MTRLDFTYDPTRTPPKQAEFTFIGGSWHGARMMVDEGVHYWRVPQREGPNPLPTETYVKATIWPCVGGYAEAAMFVSVGLLRHLSVRRVRAMTDKHTPGSWDHGRLDTVSYPQFLLDDPPPCKLIYAGEKVLALVDASVPEWKANARLMAAAPGAAGGVAGVLGLGRSGFRGMGLSRRSDPQGGRRRR
jgi:hypothetical protein